MEGQEPVKSPKTGCKGFCCEAFSLGQNSPSDFKESAVRALEIGEDETVQLADMLVPLGYYNRNPIHICGGQDGPVLQMHTSTYRGAWFYTCRHFDKGTRDCNIYEQRPHMCRSFPNEGTCEFEGCDYSKPYKMRQSFRFEGAYFSKGLEYEFGEIERFAAALGVEEHPSYARGKRLLVEATYEIAQGETMLVGEEE